MAVMIGIIATATSVPRCRARGMAAHGARVVARKGQIGYYSGTDVATFPRVTTLAELARECRKRNADFLYFSWYEAELRPEFWYPLDTSGTVPGLEVAGATESNPAVVYRIRPGFGSEPAWFTSDTLRRVHTARARVKVLPDVMVWKENFLACRRHSGQRSRSKRQSCQQRSRSLPQRCRRRCRAGSKPSRFLPRQGQACRRRSGPRS